MQNQSTIQVWKTENNLHSVVVAPGSVDDVFNRFVQLPEMHHFDLRFAKPEPEEPTWEGTGTLLYGRLYLMFREPMSPSNFRKAILHSGYEFLTTTKHLVCLRALSSPEGKSFLELWFGEGNFSEAEKITDRFQVKVLEIFKKFKGQLDCNRRVFKAEEPTKRPESKKKPFKHPPQDLGLMRRVEDETTRKLRDKFKKSTQRIGRDDVKMLLRTFCDNPDTWKQTHGRLKEFVSDEQGNYVEKNLIDVICTAVQMTTRLQNFGTNSNTGYNDFQKNYIPAFESLAKSENKPTIWSRVGLALDEAVQIELTTLATCDADLHERGGDGLFHCAGMLLALEDAGVVPYEYAYLHDTLFEAIPPEVLSRIGAWFNIDKNLALPARLAQIIPAKIESASTKGDKIKIGFLLNRLSGPELLP